MNDGVWGNDAVPRERREFLVDWLILLGMVMGMVWVLVCAVDRRQAERREVWAKELEVRRAARAARAAQAAEEAR